MPSTDQEIANVRQMALWIIEHGDILRRKAANDPQTFVTNKLGVEIMMTLASVHHEQDYAQFRFQSSSGWKAALGLRAPASLWAKDHEITDFTNGQTLIWAGIPDVTRYPQYFEIMEILDKARRTNKMSKMTNQHWAGYVAYWFLRFGDTINTGSLGDHAVKIISQLGEPSRPFSYLSDKHKFGRDFVATKLWLP